MFVFNDCWGFFSERMLQRSREGLVHKVRGSCPSSWPAKRVKQCVCVWGGVLCVSNPPWSQPAAARTWINTPANIKCDSTLKAFSDIPSSSAPPLGEFWKRCFIKTRQELQAMLMQTSVDFWRHEGSTQPPPLSKRKQGSG